MIFSIEPQGDQSVIVRLAGEEIARLCQRVQALVQQLESHPLPGIVDIVPAYCSLAVYYNPQYTSFSAIHRNITELQTTNPESTAKQARHLTLPVCYSEPYGPDLDFVAKRHGISGGDVVRLHSEATYTVAMIGFTPGFPYLLGLPEILATPRREQPRQVVAAGSVGIGGSQTGIYSLETPGGWNIIGRTPVKLFRPSDDNPSLLSAGDIVKFIEIDERKYREMITTTPSDIPLGSFQPKNLFAG